MTPAVIKSPLKKLPITHRIVILFNVNKIYDRGVITGISNYLSST